jgi:hypothetical protein
MKCFKYKVLIFKDDASRIHNWQSQIEEIFSPDYNICFNTLKGCFKSKEPREKGGIEIEVSEDFLCSLVMYATIRDSMEHQIEKFFNEISTEYNEKLFNKPEIPDWAEYMTIEESGY